MGALFYDRGESLSTLRQYKLIVIRQDIVPPIGIGRRTSSLV